MVKTSVSLLERLRRPGEAEAWRRFVQLYTPVLYEWARRLGLRGDDAADLVQDVFLVLVEKLPQFDYDPAKRFRGWLWTVIRNKLREKQRRRKLPMANLQEGELDEVPDSDQIAGLDEIEYRRYLVGRVFQLMQAEFSPTVWQACWEYVVRERPAAEVAAALGINVGSVYAAKCRVLSRLRQELDGLLD
jgi:RNA polymerase sigma-70 factor (ECF subfamily)